MIKKNTMKQRIRMLMEGKSIEQKNKLKKELMTLGWKCFLPLSLSYLIFTVSILISFNGLPY